MHRSLIRPALAMIIFCLFPLPTPAQSQSAASFQERRAIYLNSVPEESEGAFAVIAMLETGRPIKLSMIERELRRVNSRRDCSDFVMAGFLRLLFLYGHDPHLPEDMRQALTETVLNFKYWIDEPGHDSMCYWSENHQVLYHSDEYLAGLLFPDRVFTNSGMTGRQHQEKARRLLNQWFSWRERFGFSEWFSNVYYDEDLYPLLNLVDFSEDPVIGARAAMAVDQLALNISLNSFRGQFRATHGRTYEKNIQFSSGDDVKQAIYLFWGVREFTPDLARPSRSGVAAATSNYRLPEAIECIGRDRPDAMENWQAHGISMDEAPGLGLDYDDMEAGMFFWGMGMYSHHDVGDLTARMWKEYDLYENAFFMGFPGLAIALSKAGLLEKLLASVSIASESSFIEDARTYTFRTPDYQLSSVLDRKPGIISAQTLTWSATLGPDAFVFTTYPGRVITGDSPGTWTGSGSNPRVGQTRNVLVAIYNAPLSPSLGEVKRRCYSHAWFPRDAFDETLQKGNWTFGGRGQGFVALYSQHRARFTRIGPYADRELRAPGLKNVWICELGSERTDGSFQDFMNAITSSKVEFIDDRVEYASPSRGEIEFGWTGPFIAGDREVPLHRDVRYDNPYIKAPRFAERLEVQCGGSRLLLDFENHRRIMGKGE